VGEGTAVTLPTEGTWPTCTTDAGFLGTRLEAYGATLDDTYKRCDAVVRQTFTRRDRVIVRDSNPPYTATDFFNGVSAGSGDQARVNTCAAAGGHQLIPPAPTRYRLWMSDAVTQWLDPVLMPAVDGAALGRPMARAGGHWSWSTPVMLGAGSTRWEENFSPSLRVRTVEVFEPTGPGPTGKRYVDVSPSPPPLCIEDPDVVSSGCRWTCDDASATDGRLLYDLLAPMKCRNQAGAFENPSLTPTAVPLNLGQMVQTAPLRWRLAAGALTQPDLWLDFTLATTLAEAALRASPAVTDLGGARVGDTARGAFVVRNVGQQPIRIATVAMAPPGPGSPHSADFQTQLPVAPQPVPLPVEVVSSTTKETTLRVSPDAERELLHRLYRDHVLVRLAPRGQGFSETIDGHVVREQDGLLTRDVLNARFNHDVRRQPAVRMTYALRTPPFTVQPGESFEVSLRGTPSARRERLAEVRVSGASVLDPARTVEVRVLAKLYGMQGPRLSVAPAVIAIPVDGAGQQIVRTVLVENAGDVAGVLSAPRLTGAGGAALPAGSPFRLEDPYGSWSTLGIGEYREVRVHFVSACGPSPGTREDAAEVRWGTADGPIVVPVFGTTRSCP
jgi:hypothetical protein